MVSVKSRKHRWLLGAKALAWCWAEDHEFLGRICPISPGRLTIQEARLMSSWVEVLTGAYQQLTRDESSHASHSRQIKQ